MINVKFHVSTKVNTQCQEMAQEQPCFPRFSWSVAPPSVSPFASTSQMRRPSLTGSSNLPSTVTSATLPCPPGGVASARTLDNVHSFSIGTRQTSFPAASVPTTSYFVGTSSFTAEISSVTTKVPGGSGGLGDGDGGQSENISTGRSRRICCIFFRCRQLAAITMGFAIRHKLNGNT
eukprot:CAMPEP_0194536448 /NCGR_PEP_ID=MMETSP0253-20130528/75397_1 /TAXON_ID=2966 /ORGANISM="Noctiluca scintillans" /LENGTH=176 /DNA_ID=CAMNT_0039382379 /DNA_START=257 /DNA_END=783 /DNA_ORIENTATION=-